MVAEGDVAVLVIIVTSGAVVTGDSVALLVVNGDGRLVGITAVVTSTGEGVG